MLEAIDTAAACCWSAMSSDVDRAMSSDVDRLEATDEASEDDCEMEGGLTLLLSRLGLLRGLRLSCLTPLEPNAEDDNEDGLLPCCLEGLSFFK